MTAGDADGQDAGTRESVRVEVISGAPTEEELGALLAVVGEAYSEESADAVADDRHARSGWSLTQRGLRAPLRRDLGWGRYGG